jgi:hypothetical protein
VVPSAAGQNVQRNTVNQRNTIPLRNHWRTSIEDGGCSKRGTSKEYFMESYFVIIYLQITKNYLTIIQLYNNTRLSTLPLTILLALPLTLTLTLTPSLILTLTLL